MSDKTPFFIVGSGRSGTTLLRLILGGHSRIEIPPETWFVEELVPELPIDRSLSRVEVGRAVDIMTGSYRWPDMGIAADELRARALALEGPKLVDVINLVYVDHLQRGGKSRFGDKTPPYIHIVPELCVLYPGAKFIHLVRDGRDVAMSFIELHWKPRYYVSDFEWSRALRAREKYRLLPINDQILDVKYEDLVSDPETTVRKICAFLGEEFEPAMLDFSGRLASVPEGERVIHTKLNQPLSASAASKWRGRLTGFECFLMEASLQRDLRRWGYELRYASLAWPPVLALSGWLLAGLGPLLSKVVSYLQRRRYLRESIYL